VNYVNECDPRSTLGVMVAWLHIQRSVLPNGLHLEVLCDIVGCGQVIDSDSNESSSSLTVPDTPPSLRQRLLSKRRGSISETVADTPSDAVQCKLFCKKSFEDITFSRVMFSNLFIYLLLLLNKH